MGPGLRRDDLAAVSVNPASGGRRFRAAAASAADHDDLAARGLDAGQRLNVGAVRDDQEIPLPVHWSITARAPAVRDSRWSRSTTTLPKVGSASTGPSCSSVAVSMQRHHGEERIFSNAIPSDLSRAPILARVVASFGAEIALGGAVVEPKTRRVADAAGRIGMPHQGDMPAGAQRGPGLGLAGTGALRRGAEAEQDARMAKRMRRMAASSQIGDQTSGADDAEPQQQR